MRTLRPGPILLFTSVFLLTLSLYLLTIAPGVVGGDAGEHQFAAPLLGIPHTTGYPLYILLGKVWTLLFPLGCLAWRMNLFSALAGALAAATTTLVVYHLTAQTASSKGAGASLAGAFIAGLVLAGGLTIWEWSTIAGVRSLNVLFFALLTLEAILWGKKMEGLRDGGLEDWKKHPLHSANPPAFHPSTLLGLLALTVGLSLAHHRTTLFYLPSLIGWIFWHDPGLLRQPKRWLPLILLALAPLLLYGFIYFRGINNPPYSHEQISDWSSFWFLVGSGDSSGLFLTIAPVYLPAKLLFLGNDLLNQLSWPGVILALLGGVWLLWRGFKHWLFQTTLILLLVLFTLDFEVVNLNEAPAWYLMPAHFILTVWLGLGVNLIIRATWRVFPKLHPLSFIFHPLLSACLLLIFSYTLLWPNWSKLYANAAAPLDDWRQLLRGNQAQRFVEGSLPHVAPNSMIWADWEQYTPLKYYQLINGLRPDVTVRNPLNNWPTKVAAAHQANQAIYLARKPTDLLGQRYLTMVGPLIYVQIAPQLTPPVNLITVKANFEDEVELIGYQAQRWPPPSLLPPPTWGNGGAERLAGAPMVQLTLYWRVPDPVEWDYALSLRLLDAAGQEIYKKDAAHPVLSSYPTTLWTPGEVVADFYELPWPQEAGPLTVWLLLYRSEGPGQWHNLTLTGSNPPQEGLKLSLQLSME